MRLLALRFTEEEIAMLVELAQANHLSQTAQLRTLILTAHRQLERERREEVTSCQPQQEQASNAI